MNVLRPKILILTTLVITLLILLSSAQEMNRRWQVNQEIQRLEGEVHDLEKNIDHLEQLNRYFQTDDYQERIARQQLNYRAPGEHVVLIPEEDQELYERHEQQEKEEEIELSNPMKWWYTFFVHEL